MTKNYFYTSDNVSVLLTMDKDWPKCFGVGYASYGNSIYFPLLPNIYIIMYDPSYLRAKNIKIIDKDFTKLYENDVKIINYHMILSASDQVYSIDGDWKDSYECYKIYNIEKGEKPYKIE